MTELRSNPAQSDSRRLIDQVSNLRVSLARQNIHVADMSRAGSLEMRIGSLPPTDDRRGEGVVPLRIERLEGPIRARRIEGDTNSRSRFRYFLDGSQKTIPICRVGLAPVIVGLSAAGILYREIARQPTLLGESLRLSQAWIVPRNTGDPQLEELIQEVERTGGHIIDPLTDASGDRRHDYHTLIGDYGKLLTHAYEIAGRIRASQEQEALREWAETTGRHDPDHWIVVDGRLLTNVRNAVGVVKELLTQHLGGPEAVSLFDLPQGHRTTAFRYVSIAGERDGDGAPSPSAARTMWYMRLWGATGMDARHSLVRIETAHEIDSTEQIDEISRWILAERLPRPTDDPRWPTLLYPIHFLERILKRRLAEVTTGWPSL
jgi:hypothetical protein